MTQTEIIDWLMAGDVSLQYQTSRDLLGRPAPRLRARIAREGWGAQFLSARNPNGYWGRGFYQPKWISTHYTLLDLKNLGLAPGLPEINQTLRTLFKNYKGPDGGILPIGTDHHSDICVNGMLLNYSAYFQVRESLLQSVVDFLLGQQMPDGGFNCRSNHGAPVHSSLHTTLSVLEGIEEYRRNGYGYRLPELLKAGAASREFILMHRLFRSDHTGKIIKPSFLSLFYPCRWYYDILKALDYFQAAGVKYDPRMGEALEILIRKQNREGCWKLAAPHPGRTHFQMEKPGQPSRWNTLRALRVLQCYDPAHKAQ